MKQTHSLAAASAAFLLVLVFAGIGGAQTPMTPTNATLAGDYCYGTEPIVISADGSWTQDRFSGTYSISGSTVTFSGPAQATGGPSKWGPATYRSDRSLAFGSEVWSYCSPTTSPSSTPPPSTTVATSTHPTTWTRPTSSSLTSPATPSSSPMIRSHGDVPVTSEGSSPATTRGFVPVESRTFTTMPTRPLPPPPTIIPPATSTPSRETERGSPPIAGRYVCDQTTERGQLVACHVPGVLELYEDGSWAYDRAFGTYSWYAYHPKGTTLEILELMAVHSTPRDPTNLWGTQRLKTSYTDIVDGTLDFHEGTSRFLWVPIDGDVAPTDGGPVVPEPTPEPTVPPKDLGPAPAVDLAVGAYACTKAKDASGNWGPCNVHAILRLAGSGWDYGVWRNDQPVPVDDGSPNPVWVSSAVTGTVTGVQGATGSLAFTAAPKTSAEAAKDQPGAWGVGQTQGEKIVWPTTEWTLNKIPATAFARYGCPHYDVGGKAVGADEAGNCDKEGLVLTADGIATSDGGKATPLWFDGRGTFAYRAGFGERGVPYELKGSTIVLSMTHPSADGKSVAKGSVTYIRSPGLEPSTKASTIAGAYACLGHAVAGKAVPCPVGRILELHADWTYTSGTEKGRYSYDGKGRIAFDGPLTWSNPVVHPTAPFSVSFYDHGELWKFGTAPTTPTPSPSPSPKSSPKATSTTPTGPFTAGNYYCAEHGQDGKPAKTCTESAITFAPDNTYVFKGQKGTYEVKSGRLYIRSGPLLAWTSSMLDVHNQLRFDFFAGPGTTKANTYVYRLEVKA